MPIVEYGIFQSNFLYFFLGWPFLLKVGDIQCAGCLFKTILTEKSVILFSI